MREARAERSKSGVVLEYQVCSACGRNEYGAMKLRGKVIATGREARRMFVALEEDAIPGAESVATKATPHDLPVQAPEPSPAEDWTPARKRPIGDGLIRVRFISGGYFIERPSYFNDRWDLIEAWHPYDNGPGLAASFNTPEIPVELRVSSVTLASPKRAATMRAVSPAKGQEAVPVGVTLSLF
ncbi:MAG: hypothetical protein ITG07_02075 [Candidimonas sp.]|nr:hypothetical protein [Candidimonas sp.]